MHSAWTVLAGGSPIPVTQIFYYDEFSVIQVNFVWIRLRCLIGFVCFFMGNIRTAINRSNKIIGRGDK